MHSLSYRIAGVALVLALVACGDDAALTPRDSGPAPDVGLIDAAIDVGDLACSPGATIGRACEVDAECTDACFCNGQEICMAGLCAAGVTPCTSAVECAEAICDEEAGECGLRPDHASCSDGDACNGAELCDTVLGACRSTAPPYCNDDDSCTVDMCDALTGCVFLARDLDGDGHRDGRCGGDDCDDDPRFGTDIYPGAVEDCYNRRDDNCDGLRDFSELTCVPDNGTCLTARELPGPGTYSGATRGLRDDLTLRCGSSGPDAVFTLNVPELSDVRITVAGGSGTSVSFREAALCGTEADVGCASGSPSQLLRRSVAPGDYVIVVEQTTGRIFDITIQFAEPTVTPPVDVCGPGTLDISAGGTFTGFYAEVENDYQLSCYSGSVRDAVYRIVLDEPKDVTLSGSATGTSFATTYLALTTDCADNAAEFACRSVFSTSPLVFRELPAGTYYVIIETSSSSATGWSLDATITDPVPRTPGDACSTAIDITPVDAATTGSGTASFTTAELDTGTTCGGTFASYRDVTFSFTTTETHDVSISTTSDGVFHYASLRTECPILSSELGCVSGSTNRLNFRSLEAGTYFVTMARSTSSGSGRATLTLSDPTPIPPNDRCSGAIDISAGYSSLDTLVGFGDDVAGCSGFGLLDAFYTFTLTERKDALIAVRRPDGSFASHTLSLRADCTTTRNILCDSGSPAIISTTLDPGTYVLIVEASSGVADDFVIQAGFFDPV